MGKVSSVVDTVLGEAKAGNYQDMLGIVSVIDNRAKSLGVSYQDVVAAKGQFDAFGKSLPAGVGKYRDMALQAIEAVKTKGPVHSATFYATPAAAKGLPKGLSFETKTPGHNFYSDPKGRAIATTQGYKTPDMTALAQNYAKTPEVGPTPMSRPEAAEASVAYAPESNPQAAPSAFDSVLGITPTAPQTRSSLGYASQAKKDAAATMAPSAQQALATFERGLVDPSSYTVTSTAESRRGYPGLSHVTDKAAFDVRTRDQTSLDEAAVAAMYDPGVKSIGIDTNPDEPHMHVGTTSPYGKGVLSGTRTGKLSPDVAKSLRSWGQATALGQPRSYDTIAEQDQAIRDGTISMFSPIAPESIAPTPTAAPRSEPAPAAPAMTQDYSMPAGAFTNIDQASLTGPSMTGPAARSVSTQSITPGNPSASMQAAMQAQEAKGLRSAMAPAGARSTTPTYGHQMSIADPMANPATMSRMTEPGLMSGKAGAFSRQDESGPSRSIGNGLFSGVTGPTQTATPEQAAAAGRAMGALAGPETQAFSQQAFNDMTPDIGMPAPVGQDFGLLDLEDRADQLGRSVAAAPAAPTGPQMGIAGPQSGASPSARSAPASMASAADVWGGKAQQGRATNGSMVSRNPDGTVSLTSGKYGYTETMAPDGSYRSTTAPGLFGLDQAVAGLFGGIGTGKSKSETGKTSTGNKSFSEAMKGFSGKGAMRGAMMGMPAGLLGAVVGGLMGGFGRKGQQSAPGGLWSGGMMTQEQAAQAYAMGYTPGLGFPGNPGGPGQGGLTAKGEAAMRGDFGGQAETAANNPGTGLF